MNSNAPPPESTKSNFVSVIFRWLGLPTAESPLDTKRLLCVVVLIRLVYTVASFILQSSEPTLGEDYYDEIATNIASGNGFRINPEDGPNLFRYPLYPYFLAGIFYVFGPSKLAVTGVQFGLDLLTLWLVFRLATAVFGSKTGAFALLAGAIYPLSAIYIPRCSTEVLFTLLVVSSLYVLYVAHTTQSMVRIACAGVLFGLGVLCRSTMALFPLALPILAIFPTALAGRFWERSVKNAVVLLVAILCIIPWTIRNYVVTNEIIPLGTAGGYSIWLGNDLETGGRDFDELDEEGRIAFKEKETAIAGEYHIFSVEGEKRFKEVALQSMRENPVDSAILIVRKVGRFWVGIYRPMFHSLSIIVIPLQVAFLSVGLLGVWMTWRRQWFVFYILAMILSINAAHAIVTATLRYSIPVMPLVIMLGAAGLVACFDRRSGDQNQTVLAE